ncbi:MAG TPA: hypothetical protein VEF34_21610 [Syntrophobacteraceae bacterium]|nr:hypothetical protein [Syntrophobacteraceae bacterium]
MKRLVNSILASLFVFAVVAAAPLYTDYIDNANPGVVATQGPQVPDVMGGSL